MLLCIKFYTKKVLQKWNHNVSQQLQEFMFQLTSQMLNHAKSAADHRDSNLIATEDVDEALNFISKTLITAWNVILDKTINVEKVDLEQKLQEAAERLNAEPLPKIRTEYGLHTPHERFMSIQSDYRVLEPSQMQFEQRTPTLTNNFRTAPASNAYSSAIIQQTFNNNQDNQMEFD